jgi:hypothetical protein
MAPLIAAGIMAGGSLAGSLITNYYNDQASKREQEARAKAANALTRNGALTDNEYQQIINGLNDYYAKRGSIGQAGDVDAYRQAIADYNPNDYIGQEFSAEGFNNSFNKTKEDYLNPYYSRIIGDTANQIQHSAAGAGIGRGTGAALNIAKGTAEKSDELYRTALSEYNNERDFAYQQYSDAIRNNQNRLNAMKSGQEYKLGLQGNLAQDYMNTQDQAYADKLKAQQDRMAAKQAYDTAIVGLY